MLNDACLPGMLFGPSNLVDLLRHRAHYQPDDVAFTFLVDGESQELHLTYRELERGAGDRGVAGVEGAAGTPGVAVVSPGTGVHRGVLRLPLRAGCGSAHLPSAQ